MLKKNDYSPSITSLKNLNIHYTLDFPSEVYTLVQLESGLILIGLGDGSIYFYKVENITKHFFILKADENPILNIIELKNGSIVCTTNAPSICTISEHPQNKNEYQVEKRINTKSQGKQINKIIELDNEKLISVDNAYISLWSNKFDLIKEKKINSPIIDVIELNKKKFVCAMPMKKCVRYYENENLNQKYEIKNIKFIQNVEFNNIFCILNDELLFIGGCFGCIYLVNVKYNEFVANVKLGDERQIITSVYNLSNGDLLCGGSLVIDDSNKVVDVVSDLIQYKYKQYQNYFREIYRKKGIHSNIIRDLKEIINYKKMKEIITISLDGKVILLNE